MANEGLRDLYIDELKDLYNAENQLVKALPKMAKAASSAELKQGFEEHLEQTRGHVQRLEKIFKSLDESPKGKKCAGMEGLVKEGSEVMEEDFEGALMDAALIGAAQPSWSLYSRRTLRTRRHQHKIQLRRVAGQDVFFAVKRRRNCAARARHQRNPVVG
jgi:uncharacterized protein DUF892